MSWARVYLQPRVKSAEPGSISAYVHSSTLGVRSGPQRWLPLITAVACEVARSLVNVCWYCEESIIAAKRTYPVLVGALGSCNQATNHGSKEGVVGVWSRLVGNLVLEQTQNLFRHVLLKARYQGKGGLTLCSGCGLAPGTRRRAAVEASIYPLFWGTSLSPV